jgi:hypothetical protein
MIAAGSVLNRFGSRAFVGGPTLVLLAAASSVERRPSSRMTRPNDVGGLRHSPAERHVIVGVGSRALLNVDDVRAFVTSGPCVATGRPCSRYGRAGAGQ